MGPAQGVGRIERSHHQRLVRVQFEPGTCDRHGQGDGFAPVGTWIEVRRQGQSHPPVDHRPGRGLIVQPQAEDRAGKQDTQGGGSGECLDSGHRDRAEVAAELAAGAPVAQRFIKMGFDRSLEMSFEEAIEYESMAQVTCLGSEDVVEGITSFIEKRDPDFQGK